MFLCTACTQSEIKIVRCTVHSQKLYRLDAGCGFYQLDASLSSSCASLLASSRCIKYVKIRLDTESLVQTTCIKLVNKKSWESTSIEPVDNLQQTCYHQVRASHAIASWCPLNDHQVTSMQQSLLELVHFQLYTLLCTVDFVFYKIILFGPTLTENSNGI